MRRSGNFAAAVFNASKPTTSRISDSALFMSTPPQKGYRRVASDSSTAPAAHMSIAVQS